MKDTVAREQPVSEGGPVDLTATARRLLCRRLFKLLGAARGTLAWQTAHPDLESCAPIVRVYPGYDGELHDTLFDTDPTAAFLRTVGLAASGASGAKEERAHSSPVTETIDGLSTAPVWQCRECDGTSRGWLAWMYVRGGFEQPWIRRYEEHFMRCPMCIDHVEIARLTHAMFPDEAHEAQHLRRAVDAMPQK